MKGGGAELDLDRLVNEKVFSASLYLHSDGRDYLAKTWGAMAKVGPIQSDSLRLWVCVARAHADRDYGRRMVS